MAAPACTRLEEIPTDFFKHYVHETNEISLVRHFSKSGSVDISEKYSVHNQLLVEPNFSDIETFFFFRIEISPRILQMGGRVARDVWTGSRYNHIMMGFKCQF